MSVTLSYMLPCYRAFYARRLLGEIVKKTTLPYEFLVWLNLEDPGLESTIIDLISVGYPIRVVGKTPNNIGMEAFKPMIEQAKGDMLVQLEDDVLFISRRAGEIAGDIFARYPDIGMLSADLWQDELSNGGHPSPENYLCANAQDQLFEGPLDGGFSVYPRSSVPLLLESRFEVYFGMGQGMGFRLRDANKKAYKCRRMRIFHLSGAIYHSLFPGMVEFEISKYKRIRHKVIADALEDQVKRLPPRDFLEQRLRVIERYHESFDGHSGTTLEDMRLFYTQDQEAAASSGLTPEYASHIRACLYNDRVVTLAIPPPFTGGISIVLPLRDVSGCARVDITGKCEEPFTILIEEADAREMEFTETNTFVSTSEAVSGLQKIYEQIIPRGTFMRITVTNIGDIASISLNISGLPRDTGPVGMRGATGIQGLNEHRWE